MKRPSSPARCTLWAVILGLLALSPPAAIGAPPNDSYIAGYAAAVLEREFKIATRSLDVRDGVLTLNAADLAGSDRVRMIETLSRIPGVTRVQVDEAPSGTRARPASTGPPAASLDLGLLPEGRLFAPLLADPRWPHFSAAYRYYLGDRDFASAAAFSFGETFPLYRGRAGQRAHWETGLQAGVFSIFDLDSESFDLINTDFFVAAFASYRIGHLATLGRFFHQSSHLGDELLLRRVRPDRINVSYEGLDLKLAYDLPYGLRAYGGGGYLVDPEPSDLKSGSTQVGIEFRSPWVVANGMLRPVAAVDIQNREENDWGADLSLRAGVQFDNVRVMSRSLQLLLEYFSGKSSDGQFYNRSVEYIGLGAHFHF